MSIKIMAAVAAAVVGMAGAASAATLVSNGSFEQVGGLAKGGLNKGTFGIYDSIPGWKKASGSGIELHDKATLNNRDPQDGNWYVELDSASNSSMYQDITFASAGAYLLSFFYAPRTTAANDNGISYSLGSKVQGVMDAVYPAGWQQQTALFTVAKPGEVLRLSFAATGTSNSLGGLIDNVSITPAPVPLPASALLLGGALAGSGAIAARRRRKAARQA